MESEEQAQESKKAISRLQNEAAFYKEEGEKFKAKNGVVELYASDLQRKIDALTLELKEKSDELDKVRSNDWTKRLMECNAQVDTLRDQLLEQERKYNDLKSQLAAATQVDAGNKKHFEIFVEEQSKELLKAQKIVSILLKLT